MSHSPDKDAIATGIVDAAFIALNLSSTQPTQNMIETCVAMLVTAFESVSGSCVDKRTIPQMVSDVRQRLQLQQDNTPLRAALDELTDTYTGLLDTNAGNETESGPYVGQLVSEVVALVIKHAAAACNQRADRYKANTLYPAFGLEGQAQEAEGCAAAIAQLL